MQWLDLGLSNVGFYWKFISKTKLISPTLHEQVAQNFVSEENQQWPVHGMFIAKVRETDFILYASRRGRTRKA